MEMLILFHHSVHSAKDFLEKIGNLFHTAESSRKGSYIIHYYEDCRRHRFAFKEFPHVFEAYIRGVQTTGRWPVLVRHAVIISPHKTITNVVVCHTILNALSIFSKC